MKSKAILSLLFLLLVSSSATLLAAEAKPASQVTWENTLAAAKKEGRLNFYVGRYGSEPLLNEFRKEFPEIKIFSTNGTGNSLGTRIVAEARAGSVLADLYSGGAVTNFEILYKAKVLGSLKSALILPEILTSPSGTAASTATTTPNSSMYLSTLPIRLQRAFTSIPIWSIRKTSSPTGNSSTPSGKVNMFLKSRPARASVLPCNFSFTMPSLGRNFCGNSLSTCNPFIAAIGAR